MKKIIFVLAALFVTATLSSCATAVNIDSKIDPVVLAPQDSNPQIDFIGFNATTETMPGKVTDNYESRSVEVNKVDLWKDFYDGTSLNHMGEELELAKIANNCSDGYFGDFSTEDLAHYVSKNGSRYVSFVNVNDFSCTVNESDATQANLITYGTSALSVGLVASFVGVVFPKMMGDAFPEFAKTAKTIGYVGFGLDALGAGLLAWGFARPVNSTFFYSNTFQIVVYDTKDKVFVKKENVKIDQRSDTFKGSYKKGGSEAFNAIRIFYGQLAQNELENKYLEVANKLN